MRIYHIAVTKRERVLSGGETCMISLIQYLRNKKLQNFIVTTPIGKESFEEAGLKEDGIYIRYIVNTLTQQESRLHVYPSWIISAIKSFFSFRLMRFIPGDSIMCYSYFFPDFLLAYAWKKRNKHIPVFYWYHMLSPRLWYGYRGEFTGIKHIPALHEVLYKLNEYIFRYFVDKTDIIITVSKYYLHILKKVFPGMYIYCLTRFGGGKNIDSSGGKKIYDLIWVGRFHPQKGLFELLDIVTKLVSQVHHLKIVIIGDGPDTIKNRFMNELKERGLMNNIICVGAVVRRSIYLDYIRKAKVYITTSLYEGFGLANLEAMKQGLPVVAYDLPPYEPLKGGLITVPILDNDLFVQKIVKLLRNKRYCGAQAKKAYAVSKEFTWETMGDEVFSLIQKYVQK